MSENFKKDSQSFADKMTEEASEEKPYLYKEAGIMEGHGKIPLWLILVTVGLIIWSIYYTIKYWSAG